MFALAAVVAAGLAGCGGGKPWSDPALESVEPSAELAPHLRDGYRVLEGPDGGDPAVSDDLERYEELRQGLYDFRTRSAASDSLYAEWRRRPNHVLWPELAVRDRRYLKSPGRFWALFERPECADTTTAIGVYMEGWRGRSSISYRRHFPLAWSRLGRVDDFPSLWIGLKAAYGDRSAGRAERALATVLKIRPAALDLGGKRLEGLIWEEVARISLMLGRLDDALHAVVLAQALYEAGMPADGAVPGMLRIREVRADVHAARRETATAFAVYENNTRVADDHHQSYLAGRNLADAGSLSEATGDRELGFAYLRRAIPYAVADADSLIVPRMMMNVARRFRLDGDLDSCLVYQDRAWTWVRAYSDQSNVGRMALLSADYYSQIGDYAAFDSLLAIATSHDRNHDTAAVRAELHLKLIEGWMEVGRADLIERSIAAIEDLREGFVDAYADRNTSADLNLAVGEFKTRRGEYAEAARAFDLAEDALERKADDAKAWLLARNRGLLARERDDLTSAEAEFRTCIRLGVERATPEEESTGRFLLGSVLLAQGRYADARTTFPSTDASEFVGSFVTRVSAMLLTGKSYAREGRFDEALAVLASARAACGDESPDDLVARIDLETGSARAGAGDVAGAAELFEDVADRLAGSVVVGASPDLAYFNGDLRRDLVEASMTLPGADPEASLRTARRILPGWSTARAADGRALASPQIVFFVGETTSGRWLVGDDGVSWRSLPGAAELRGLVAPVAADMSLPGRTPVAADVARLSDVLLGDLAAAWPEDATLAVVPDRDLFVVPWAALELPGSGGVAVDRGALTIFDRPVFAGDGGRRHRGEGRILVVAADDDPGARDAGLAGLRDAEGEARDVGGAWPDGAATLSLGAAAAAPLAPGEDLAGYEVLHVAGHAKVYGGGTEHATLLLSGVDGRALTAGDIEALDLDAALVFLSCCESAGGRDRGAGYAGLARGFLDAGAASVVAPVNAVDDAAARAFAVRFYAHWLEGASVAEALRETQIEMKRGDPRWRHPCHWAFYQVIRG